MSCKRVRRELLERFAFGEELGRRSGPHLAHLESCAECREEVGIERALVIQLRRALQERVDGGSPPEASWELVRRRTVGRPARPWTARVLHSGGIVSAMAAAVMMFAVANAPEARILPRTPSPVLVASVATRAVPPVEEAGDRLPVFTIPNQVPKVPPLPGWPMEPLPASEGAPSADEPPITGRMR